jgi:hypothetical protein
MLFNICPFSEKTAWMNSYSCPRIEKMLLGLIVMKVKELIAELQKVDPELPVRVYADHGQCSMDASTMGVRHADKDEEGQWMIEESFGPEEVGNEEYTELTKEECFTFFEIGSP